MIPLQKQERTYDDPTNKPFSLKGIFNKKWLLISVCITITYGVVFTVGGYLVGVFDDLSSLKLLKALLTCIIMGIAVSPLFEYALPRLFK